MEMHLLQVLRNIDLNHGMLSFEDFSIIQGNPNCIISLTSTTFDVLNLDPIQPNKSEHGWEVVNQELKTLWCCSFMEGVAACCFFNSPFCWCYAWFLVDGNLKELLYTNYSSFFFPAAFSQFTGLNLNHSKRSLQPNIEISIPFTPLGINLLFRVSECLICIRGSTSAHHVVLYEKWPSYQEHNL